MNSLINRIRDVVLEIRIRWHRHRLLNDESGRKRHAAAFSRLIKSRSPSQIARMEREKGLS